MVSLLAVFEEGKDLDLILDNCGCLPYNTWKIGGSYNLPFRVVLPDPYYRLGSEAVENVMEIYLLFNKKTTKRISLDTGLIFLKQEEFIITGMKVKTTSGDGWKFVHVFHDKKEEQ
ncbi:MAG: hypothetical protein GYA51_02995 [Candidatus Methanofastidiosa archaeon]|nr:hypothetical protein [Candidatus Methanofastidiosa archaeon]